MCLANRIKIKEIYHHSENITVCTGVRAYYTVCSQKMASLAGAS